jgi:predicted metalloprotease with PDZ domain
VDDTIRGLTADKKSLNDFCRVFYGDPGNEPSLKTYSFDDVVAGLNGIAPYDWAGFLRARLDSTSPNTPIEAVERAGWKLVYNDQPNAMDTLRKRVGLERSLGLAVNDAGDVFDVVYGGPSYDAGLAPGMKIIAVNGRQYSADELRSAVEAAKTSTEAIALIASNGAAVNTYSIEYHGGLRYPHIERDESRPDYLSEILHPLAK